jgi:hypothetical protein
VLSSEKRVDLEAALYDLNTLSRKLSRRMMAKEEAQGESPVVEPREGGGEGEAAADGGGKG